MVDAFALRVGPSRRLPLSPVVAATLVGSGSVLLWALWPALVVWAQPLPTFQTLAGGFGAAFACFCAQRVMSGRRVRGMLRMPAGIFLAGLLGILGTNVFFILGARAIGAGATNVISYLWPILVVVLGALLSRSRLSPRQLAGALIAFAGAAVVIRPEGAVGADLGGIVLALLSGVSWAGYSLYRMRHAGGPRDAVGAFCGAAALLCLATSLATETMVMPTSVQALAVIGIGLAPMGFANLLWDHGMRRGDPQTLAVLAYTTPLLGVLLLWLTGAASPGWPVAAGAALIVAGALLATLRARY